MKKSALRFKTLLLVISILALTVPLVATAASIVNDTFADGNSQNQDLPNNSLRIFNGRSTTVRTDAVGSVTFDLTNTTSSDAFWAFFTNAGSPVTLKLVTSCRFQGFSLTGFVTGGQDIRFGVLNSLGTRNANNHGRNERCICGDPAMRWGSCPVAPALRLPLPQDQSQH